MSKDLIINNSTPDPNSGCWLWTGSSDKDGYGLINISKKLTKAHRLSYSVFKGVITKPYVCHSCDTPSCVNPTHLFLGSSSDNAKDMQKKRRSAISRYPDKYVKRGKDHKDSILNEESVRFIRKNMIPYHPEFGAAALGRKYGVSEKAISQAFHKKAWKWVKEENEPV